MTLTEAMVAEVCPGLLPATILVRRVTVQGGPVGVVIEFDPRHGEDHGRPRVRAGRRSGLVCQWGSVALSLDTDPGLTLSRVGRLRWP